MCIWMRKSIPRCFGKAIKPLKKSNICGRNSCDLRQVYSLVLAEWILEINFPDPGSENNSLSFGRERRGSARYSSVGITSDPRITWRWVLKIPVQPDSLSKMPSLSLSYRPLFSLWYIVYFHFTTFWKPVSLFLCHYLYLIAFRYIITDEATYR